MQGLTMTRILSQTKLKWSYILKPNTSRILDCCFKCLDLYIKIFQRVIKKKSSLLPFPKHINQSLLHELHPWEVLGTSCLMKSSSAHMSPLESNWKQPVKYSWTCVGVWMSHGDNFFYTGIRISDMRSEQCGSRERLRTRKIHLCLSTVVSFHRVNIIGYT